MRYIVFCTAILLLAGCSVPDNTPKAIAKNAALSEQVEVCIACHGPDGKNGKEGVPPLGGRSYDDLMAAMHKVKESYSPQPLIGHSLSDEEMRDIAAYFSSIK
jgi:cytochrome c553